MTLVLIFISLSFGQKIRFYCSDGQLMDTQGVPDDGPALTLVLVFIVVSFLFAVQATQGLPGPPALALVLILIVSSLVEGLG